jgi:hypothetical protein
LSDNSFIISIDGCGAKHIDKNALAVLKNLLWRKRIMYQAFDLSLSDSDLLKYSTSAAAVVSDFKSRSRASLLKNFKDGVVNAAELEKDWFGEVKADVFISHSHADLGLATKLASILENTLGLTTFVDSHVWGYSDELLKIIDKEFCWSEKSCTYDYDLRNKSTSHVHLMLSAALTKMIDRCELVLFLNTENSISSANYVSTDQGTTASPWIYFELMVTKFVRKKILRIAKEEHSRKEVFDSILAKSMPQFNYQAHLSHLIKMNSHGFNYWCNSDETGTNALDFLYKYYQASDKK